MNGHNHHSKILDSGRFSSQNAKSTAGSVSSASSSTSHVASLCNLGNTCFANSVLYTLRFTPGFLHNLHHLVSDLGLSSHASSNGKDKKKQPQQQPVTNCNNDAETERVHDVIEQLHDLFRHMASSDEHLIDSNSSKEPIQPSNFLHAVCKMHTLFELNQQQDAHELLFQLLSRLSDLKIPPPPPPLPPNSCPVIEEEVDGGKKKKGKKSSFLNGHNTNVKLVSSIAKNNEEESSSSSSSSSNGSDDTYNFVRDNFEGKIVFRTKCLECESSTYRSDKFINVDIPLNFLNFDEELSENGFNGEENKVALSVADLFLKQIMASETVRENNKYFCVECSRYNEAQRSVQYELLPKVLVLQLKRFTAATNKSAFMSKINDFIPTPFTMNCFCTQCLSDGFERGQSEQKNPKHHYRLFAVINHLGATLASGHYIAYVRASVDLNLDYSRCPKAAQLPNYHHRSSANSVGNGSSSANKRGIMKYFSRSGNTDTKMSNGTDHSSLNQLQQQQQPSHCRSANCCGMQRVLCQLNSKGQQRLHRSEESLSNGNSETDSLNGSQMEDVWLECDDENISLISRRQFEEELNSKQSAATPYLLLYERV